MTFRVVPSLVQSRWLNHGYVCLSPPVLHKEMDLSIFMDINPNPEPPNCLSCLYLNARSLKAFEPSSVDPLVKVCKISNVAYWLSRCVKRYRPKPWIAIGDTSQIYLSFKHVKTVTETTMKLSKV